MPTVQELNVLHRRYTDLSQRFRATWTFHQFLQGLSKTVLDRQGADHATAFQDLYGELKEISQNLNATEGELVRIRLDGVDRRLADLLVALDAEDSKVGANALRQFFKRVRGYDEKILTQLVRFYLYAPRRDGWPAARLDKIDFLLARLSEEDDAGQLGQGLRLRDTKHLNEIFEGLWMLLGAPPLAPEVVTYRRGEVETLRGEIQAVEGLDQLYEREVIQRFRELKHGLSDFYFEPSILISVQATNLVLRARIQELYQREERRFISEYQRIFELERQVSGNEELDQDLTAFREQIERFEQRLQSDDFKLEDLAQIRESVRHLMPRLAEAGGQDPGAIFQEDTGEIQRAAASPVPAAHADLIGAHYRRLVDAIQELPPTTDPKEATVTPEIYPLRLEPREIVACRRVCAGEDSGVALERFLLEAAALRLRGNEEAQEIASLLDETSHTGAAPIFDQARETCRVADLYLWRFSHEVHQCVLGGDLETARQLELLRMRLMRDYSGLWLLAYRPSFQVR
ncbi:MAG TPA: hypothetical protein VN783_00595 [Thermoanaerobaculia bacterium]|nr:hypothetical protein [Thermoanaerobaculia bacterium]